MGFFYDVFSTLLSLWLASCHTPTPTPTSWDAAAICKARNTATIHTRMSDDPVIFLLHVDIFMVNKQHCCMGFVCMVFYLCVHEKVYLAFTPPTHNHLSHLNVLDLDNQASVCQKIKGKWSRERKMQQLQWYKVDCVNEGSTLHSCRIMMVETNKTKVSTWNC